MVYKFVFEVTVPVEGSCQHSCGDNSSFDEVILFLKKEWFFNLFNL